MRTRWLVPVVATLVIAASGWLMLTRHPDTASTSALERSRALTKGPAGGGALSTRTITAGEVVITIEPVRIDGDTARFNVAMETHSDELSADLAVASVLEVGGVEWIRATWSGDPPGGHHRQGELSFTAVGPAAGSVVLSIDGFSSPVRATWTLDT
jgi:hypothetical protein